MPGCEVLMLIRGDVYASICADIVKVSGTTSSAVSQRPKLLFSVGSVLLQKNLESFASSVSVASVLEL